MLRHIFVFLCTALGSLERRTSTSFTFFIVLLLASISCLLLWRLWRFTLLPLWNPDEPREIPYWTPGHALTFFQDSHKLMARGVELHGNTFEPFAITVAGTKYYILPSAADATTFYNNTTTLSWDWFLNEVLVGFGVNPSRLETLWTPSTVATPINPCRKNLINLTEDLYKKHLLPGYHFDALISRLKQNLDHLLSWDEMSGRFGFGSKTGTHRVSLLDLCGDILIDATQAALYDPILFKIDPEMTNGMQMFTDELWKLMYPCPGINATEVKKLRTRYTKAFLTYMRLPKDTRKGEAWLITTLIDQYEELGINEDDAAAMLVMVYWTGDANAYKLAFWILSYILFDENLYNIIRKETAPAIRKNDINMKFLTDNCPRLKSVYYETMRITKRDIAIRKVAGDTFLNGKHLRAGNSVIVPICQLHDNEFAFGSDHHTFDPDRFINNSALASNSSYKPFGGGRTYCPGRYLALPEIFAFIALLLHRWEIKLDQARPADEKAFGECQSFPRKDESTLTMGVSRPLPTDKLWVRLTAKHNLDI